MKLKIGDKVGKLTVLEIEKVVKEGKTRVFCICQCDCGNVKKIRMDSISTKAGEHKVAVVMPKSCRVLEMQLTR